MSVMDGVSGTSGSRATDGEDDSWVVDEEASGETQMAVGIPCVGSETTSHAVGLWKGEYG